MPSDIQYDFFVSYASADNREGWVDAFVAALVEEHNKFTGGRTLKYFLDRNDIQNLSHWRTAIFNEGLSRSRFFLAFLSPNYFASEICRREWRAWIEQEISLHILEAGLAPIYFVEVPGFLSKPMLTEHEVAARVAELCNLAFSTRFRDDLSPVVQEARRRQLVNLVQPLQNAGIDALREADLVTTLEKLARHIDERAEQAIRADASVSTVPPYNRKFTGRVDELVELRKLLTDNRAGVIAGIHGLGGIGKTELAYTFAHAYASVYPGGRFVVPCEFQTDLKNAILRLDSELDVVNVFRPQITDDERKHPDQHFAAVRRVLKQRIDEFGSVLLVLDNVSSPSLLEPTQTDQLTVLGRKLHVLATTRLLVGSNVPSVQLGEMKRADALTLLEKYRPFDSDSERNAAEEIVDKLGGFALAIELVAAGLAVHETATYAEQANQLGLEDLDRLAEDADISLRRHNHERRLEAVIGPTLDSLVLESRRMMEYTAYLPADTVPLPWLETLLIDEFPALATRDRLKGDLWESLVHDLVRLGLFMRVEEEETNRRLVRVHRMIQQLVRKKLSEIGRVPIFEQGMNHPRRVRLIQRIFRRLIFRKNRARRAEHDILNKLVEHGYARIESIYNEPFAASMSWEVTALHDFAWQLIELEDRDGFVFGHQVCKLLSRDTKYLEVRQLLTRILEIPAHVTTIEPLELAIALADLATNEARLGKLKLAKSLFQRTIGELEGFAKPGEDESTKEAFDLLQSTISNLAVVEDQLENREAATTLRRRVHEMRAASSGTETTDHSLDLALIARGEGKLETAAEQMRELLALREATAPSEDKDLAVLYYNLGSLEHELGHPAVALPLLERALEIDRNRLAENHPTLVFDYIALAVTELSLRHLDQARQHLTEALRINESHSSEGHYHKGYCLFNLASVEHAAGNKQLAKQLCEQALPILESTLPPTHSTVIKCYLELSKIERQLGDRGAARVAAEHAIAGATSAKSLSSVLLSQVWYQLGVTQAEQNEWQRGGHSFGECLKVQKAYLPPDDLLLAHTYYHLALAAEQTGQNASAIPLMKLAHQIFVQKQRPDDPFSQRCGNWLNRVVGNQPPSLSMPQSRSFTSTNADIRPATEPSQSTPDSVKNSSSKNKLDEVRRQIVGLVNEVRALKAGTTSRKLFAELLVQNTVKALGAIAGDFWIREDEENWICLSSTRANLPSADHKIREAIWSQLAERISVEGQPVAVMDQLRPIETTPQDRANSNANAGQTSLHIQAGGHWEKGIGILEIVHRSGTPDAARSGYSLFVKTMAEIALNFLNSVS